jgi:deoxyribonuclease IV
MTKLRSIGNPQLPVEFKPTTCVSEEKSPDRRVTATYFPMELVLGSHLSIAGGYYKAAESAGDLGFKAVQIFTKNNNQWAGKPLSDEDIRLFRASVATRGLAPPISHNSYLINLASSDETLRRRSIDAMVVELERAFALGVPHVVAHPGAHVCSDDETGLRLVVKSIDEVFQRTASLPTTIALETTAGQGTCLGWRFEHLRSIIGRVAVPQRITVCVDTCHVFAAGYPLAPKRKYMATMRELDRAVGVERVVAFHVNDSKKPLGSRVDRHAHIGRGFLGDEPFRLLLHDRRFRGIPMILETPKEQNPQTQTAWDVVNRDRLLSLATKK